MNKETANGLLWTRTILECYNKLPRMAKVLEKAGTALVKSSLMTGHYARGYTTEELYEKMIEINYRKVGIINLKVLTDQALRRIETSLAEALRAKFFQGLDVDMIAEEKGVTTRTVFRKIERGIEKLYEQISALGFDGERLDMEYSDEPLIMHEKKRTLKNYSSALCKRNIIQSPRSLPVCV